MSEAARDPHLTRLAQAYGIATEFWDWKGVLRPVADATLVAVLRALDVDAATPDAAAAALAERELRPWRAMVPPVVAARQGVAQTFAVHVDDGASVRVSVALENGGEVIVRQTENWNPPREVDGRLVGEASFQLPTDLPLGYHRIQAVSGEQRGSGLLVVSPVRVGIPERLGQRRVWGYAAQFYSVRSRASWGIGDFADLAEIATWSGAAQGADFVLTNPIHAAAPVAPLEPSPYSPSSRRFINPIYIRVEAIAEYATMSDKKRARVAEALEHLRRRLPADRLDRDLAWTFKLKALRFVYRAGLSPARELAFEAFRRREGEQLRRFAVWSALAAVEGVDFRAWPAELRDPDSPAVAEFTERNAKAVRFFEWLQWIADAQRATAQLAATEAGMALGIINDLAVGIADTGQELWAMPDMYAGGVGVGAPPDMLNQIGQAWDQPPLRPDRLADVEYEPYRRIVAAALRHSGGLRIDHIMGLFRLWWIPDGSTPGQGTYVYYDHEAMVGILALEASRAGVLVVGEDLGTVEPWVRDYLAERGILGTSILWFEDDDGVPLPAESWRAECLGSVTSHDLPPSAGYLAGDHIRLRAKLNLLTEPVEVAMADSLAEQASWLAELERRGFLAPEETDVEQIVLALHRFLAATPARVLCPTLTDAVGDRLTQNQPGTIDEYPNWRVPLSGPDGRPIWLEEIFGSERADRLAAVMNAAEATPQA